MTGPLLYILVWMVPLSIVAMALNMFLRPPAVKRFIANSPLIRANILTVYVVVWGLVINGFPVNVPWDRGSMGVAIITMGIIWSVMTHREIRDDMRRAKKT